MPYRGDIDGLRALSVVAVLLFHAGAPWLAGGFVGVDVFFVISGFLITGLILHEQRSGTFTLTGFYHRRIRRILPALFTMMAACAIAGWFLLAPIDYRQLARSILAAALSLSNFLFQREVGYFDTLGAEKPLLHTWSLGVEEQFYLVFPLFLMGLAYCGARWRIPLTAAICGASLLAGIVATQMAPASAFYLPHYRVWELLVGALLAMGIAPQPRTARMRGGAALCGLMLIVGSALFFSERIPFPGVAASVPVLGAALVLWSGIGGAAPTDRILASSPAIFVGKISYSLYLWHFPLLAFATYIGFGELSGSNAALALAAATLLAVLSWRFVEQPARLAAVGLPWRRIAAMTAAAILAFVAFGMVTSVQKGYPARTDLQAAGLQSITAERNVGGAACYTETDAEVAMGVLCVLGDRAAPSPSFVLWGDSHAETLRSALEPAARANQRSGLFAGERGCPPLIAVERPTKPACRQINAAVLALILSTPSIEDVFLSARWAWWTEGLRIGDRAWEFRSLVMIDGGAVGARDNHAVFALGLDRTVATLRAAGKRVWLIGPVAEIGRNVPRYFFLRGAGLLDNSVQIRPTRVAFEQRQSFALQTLAEVGERHGAGLLWPHRLLCGSTHCDVARNGAPLYYDDNHLSARGAEILAPLFGPAFGDAAALTAID